MRQNTGGIQNGIWWYSNLTDKSERSFNGLIIKIVSLLGMYTVVCCSMKICSSVVFGSWCDTINQIYTRSYKKDIISRKCVSTVY